MKLFHPFDFAVAAVLICISGFALLHFRGDAGSFAEVYVDEKKAATFNLNVPEQTKTVETPIGAVHIRYGNGSIRVAQSPCPQKICILQGAIRHTHDQIVCVPARLTIRIFRSKKTNADGSIDAITY